MTLGRVLGLDLGILFDCERPLRIGSPKLRKCHDGVAVRKNLVLCNTFLNYEDPEDPMRIHLILSYFQSDHNK
jgi:hypothetical protein